MIEVVPFEGWPHALRLSNGTAALVITLDVGPRILSYTRDGGVNPLKLFAEQAGGSGEPTWRIRGGHRLWLAPEHRTDTYVPDNAPVAWEQRTPLSVRLTPPPEASVGWQKQLEVTLEPTGTGVTLTHRITRVGATPATMAPWALTVMTPGGVAVIPQPELGEHPRDLLPNRQMVLWPYTDLSDPRWQLGPRYFLLRHDPQRGPTKLGLRHSAGWCGYLVQDVFFLKRYAFDPHATYADGGCIFETFASRAMLELESLGPLTNLAPGQSAEHVERWELHNTGESRIDWRETDIDRALGPILASTPRV